MAKSRHRKNHKQKVEAFKQTQKDKKNAFLKNFREKFKQQFNTEVQAEVDKLNENEG